MIFNVNMLLNADHYNLTDSTAVVTAEDYLNIKNHMHCNYSQIIVYGSRTKKMEKEVEKNVGFVNTPMGLFKKAIYKNVWVLSKDLYFHLNRWIESIHTDSNEIPEFMKYNRLEKSGLLAKHEWARASHHLCLKEYFLKSSRCLSKLEKENIVREVRDMVVKSCNPQLRRDLENSFLHVTFHKHRDASTGKFTGRMKYTVKLMEPSIFKVMAICRMEVDTGKSSMKSSIEIVFNERSSRTLKTTIL